MDNRLLQERTKDEGVIPQGCKFDPTGPPEGTAKKLIASI